MRPLVTTYIRIAILSVAVRTVAGTLITDVYKSITVPFVMPSGFAELLAISVSVAPLYLYNSI